jgi:hypothetical protein
MYGQPNCYTRFEHGKSVYKDGSKKLNDDQKVRRNEVSAEMLERLETEPDFLTRVITSVESWYFFSNMTLKPSGRARIDTRHDLQDRRKLA